MNNGFIRKILENFGLIATFVGFTVDTLTLIALINSKISPTIPYIDYQLDSTFQLILWIITFVTYIGFLREKWLRISRKLSSRPEETFSRFLIYDIIVDFKYPFYIIPLVVFAGVLFFILTQLSFTGWIFLIISVVITAIVIQSARKSQKIAKQSQLEWELIRSEKDFSTWAARIEKELSEKGYATDIDLRNLYSERRSLCDKAMWKYHYMFEMKYDLICVQEDLEKKDFLGDNIEYLTMWVIAPRKLSSTRPWLNNHFRYFN
jgi:hypothetical protein